MEQALEVLDRESGQIVNDIGIPPCPAILTKLMQEMRNEDPDFAKLGKLIGSDVSLAAAMLKTVNSPFYGLRTKASSVQQAIALLGLRNVAQLVTGLMLRDAFPGGASAAMEEYWESSAAIAEISAALARQLKCANRDDVYTFALFRDCGIPVMMGALKEYKLVFPGSKDPGYASVTDFEDSCYGINHARVGSQLAQTWLLPEHICQAVMWHHRYVTDPDAVKIPVTSSRHIALALAAESLYARHKMGTRSAEWNKGADFALATLGITEAEFAAAGERAIKEYALSQ